VPRRERVLAQQRLWSVLGLFNAVNILVWNFPAEVAALASLLHVLFQKIERRNPRESADAGKRTSPHPVLHVICGPKTERMTPLFESARGVTRGSIVLMDVTCRVWKPAAPATLAAPTSHRRSAQTKRKRPRTKK